MAVALVTIALGTASTTAVLTVWNALVVRTVQASDVQSLYLIDEIRSGAVSQPLSVDAIPYERFLAYRESLSDVFSGLAADRYRFPAGFSLVVEDAAVSANGYVVTGNYFDVLGLVPAAGGFFANDLDPAVVISFDLWQRAFAGDPSVVGRTLQIDSRPYTVVGVAPEGFQGTLHVLASDLWLPIEAYTQGDTTGFDWWVTFFGRLRPGVTPEQAAAAVEAAALGIPPLQPQTRVRGAEIASLTGLPPALEGPLERFLYLLFATGLIVLLIAAANIVGMLLARGVARRREVSVRLALGAGSWRIVRQSLTETSLLFLVGGLLGLWLGSLGATLLEAVRLPLGVEMSVDLSTDLRVLGLSLVLTGLVGALFGLLPSFQAARGNIVAGLKLITHGAAREAWGWRLFVRAQLAFSVLLLVTAGLFVRSLQKAAAIDLGFDAERMVVAQVDLSAHGYDQVRGALLFQELVDQVRAVPGVTSASLASTVLLGPFYGRSSNDMRPRDEGAPEDVRVNAAYNVVEPEYFETLGMELLMGRTFTSSDVPGSVDAVIVNEALASGSGRGRTRSGAACRAEASSRSWASCGTPRRTTCRSPRRRTSSARSRRTTGLG